MRRRI
jgi:sRNA-binding regulator protein Hfq